MTDHGKGAPLAAEEAQLLRKRRIVSLVSLGGVITVLALLTWLIGRPLLDAMRNRSSFRAWMQAQGFLKYPLMVGIMALQVIIAFIPGGPIEVVAGYIFGAWGGLLLCVLGSLLGSFLIILAVRTWGMKLVKLFVTENQLASMRFFKDTKKRDATIFLLFLLPGTPKDALTYLCGLVPMRSWQYLLLTTLARAPSILFSTMGGHLLGEEEYRRAVLILGITLALTLAAALAYRAHQRKAATAAKAPSDPGTGEGENVKDRGADDVPS